MAAGMYSNLGMHPYWGSGVSCGGCTAKWMKDWVDVLNFSARGGKIPEGNSSLLFLRTQDPGVRALKSWVPGSQRLATPSFSGRQDLCWAATGLFARAYTQPTAWGRSRRATVSSCPSALSSHALLVSPPTPCGSALAGHSPVSSHRTQKPVAGQRKFPTTVTVAAGYCVVCGTHQ